ncbi:YrhK family protein [Flavimaricola marinus]|uniref:YrhK domain-containing protein n=1 Tax=Flavimaricola marinus TaxID=1819565 RepID=A0A238LB05_9RHOB|nr:YrhK family protein [Flavimaricola marinus]SMY06781.1 hypothetical protein LOM8899_00911 [Flavimaricola marinus]
MIFTKDLRSDSDQRRRYALYEIAYTMADFLAAALFVIGSVMFFSDAWQTVGTWMFLFGSILFACKPTIRLVRELHLAAMGDTKDIAERLKD